MENPNAEQVKKAHEHCTTKVICKGCPCWREDKKCTLREDTLALITSQEQRIKELAEENERLRGEIEQQHEINQVLRYLYVPYAECFDNVDPNKDCDAEDLISRYGDLIKNKGETTNEN